MGNSVDVCAEPRARGSRSSGCTACMPWFSCCTAAGASAIAGASTAGSSAGDLLVVFPEHPHQYGPEAGDEWDEVFIAFKGAAFEGWRACGLDPVNPVWSLPDPESGPGGFSKSYACRSLRWRNRPRWPQPSISSLPMRWHNVRQGGGLAGKGPAASRWRRRCPGATDHRRRPGMSHDHFRKAFKAATGESPSAFRRRRRLAQAALMLQRSDLKLDMIAESLGFCDGFHLPRRSRRNSANPPPGSAATRTVRPAESGRGG